MRALYREHAGPLLAYVLRLVAGDRQRAEDVVQETLIRAWKNAGQLNRATGSVRPWLVTVARRIVIDGHRSRQARSQEVDPSPLEVIPAEDEIDKALWLMTPVGRARRPDPGSPGGPRRDVLQGAYRQ